ncbi:MULTISPECIES: DUF445 domain-containing protein [Solirubrobacterales]|nr:MULTISPECIES: DUF445 domain-containing protein [Solirubrobacterales]
MNDLHETDESRLRGLRRMQAVALGLLLLAAAVYALTFGQDGALGYVNAAAEASMVGAVADWFAVTALFRHPLGLPIPHTALIPRRKQQLGRSLESFVTENFLTAEIVRDRVLDAEPARRAGTWIGRPENAARVVRRAAPTLARGLDGLQEDEVRAIVEQAVLPRLANESLAPVVGHVLERVLDDRAHTVVVDLVIVETHDWLVDNADTVTELVTDRLPEWSPRFVERGVSRRVYREFVRFVAEIRDDPHHRARAAADELLRRLARDLQHDPRTRARADELKRRILAGRAAADAATSLTLSVREALTAALRDERGALQERASVLLADLGARLLADDALRARVDERTAEAVTSLVDTYGAELTTVITHTIDQWDGDEAARRLELMVGRDLQFIRINGTVVGGLAGLLIHALSELL